MLRWAHLPECALPIDGWHVKQFTDIANVIAGQSPPSETYNEKGDGLPFLQGNADFSFEYPVPELWCSAPVRIAKKDDTLISVRAPVGEVNRADQSYAIGRGLAAIRAFDANPDFIYHALQRWRWSLKRVAQGSTFDAVTAKHFAQLSVAVPQNIDEQSAIAHILNALDITISRARVAVTKAVDVRNSLLAELLSRGVDDHGQVRDPVRFANQFTKTSLGMLPRDWRPSKIGNEFDLQNGFTINASQQSNKQLRRYLRVANVHRDNLRLDDIQELQANDNEFAPRVLELNDLLVVEGHADRMQIGRCARVNEQAIGLTFQNHLFRLRTKGEILPYFGCLWLNSAYAQRYWNAQCATSSGLNTINQRMLKRMLLPVPSEHEQQIIETLIEKQRNHLDALRNKLSSLIELKKSLMHDLLTGTVRVDLSILSKVASI